MRWTPDACTGASVTSGAGPAAGWAASCNSGTTARPSPPASLNGITEALDDRLEDRRRRFELLQVMTVAVARAVVQLFGHLRVARGARVAAVFVEGEAALIERLADEIEHAADRALLLVDDVLIADRHVMQRHLRAVMLDQIGYQREVA